MTTDAQPGSFQLALGQVQPGPSGYVEVSNPNPFDADVGGYRLQGAVQLAFPPGEERLGCRRASLPASSALGCLCNRLADAEGTGLSVPPAPASGTVIPARDSVYAAVDVGGFKAARGGQGLFVVGPLKGQLLGPAASVQLLDESGATVAST